MKQQRPILILLAVSLLIGIFTLNGYGDSWDDLSLRKYAAKSLEAYGTWVARGEVQITTEDLGSYGPSYVMAVALLSQDNPDLRHFIYFVTFLAGAWAFYMLGLRWLSQPAALGATLLYLTQPVLWGHAFFNPKDTPFLSLFLLSIYFGLKLFDESPNPIQGSDRRTALLTALWLGSVFSLFLLTDTFHTAIVNLVHAAKAGETNIISLTASDIRTAAPELYIQKYFTLFLRLRAVFFLLSSFFFLFHKSFRSLHPSAFTRSVYPSVFLGFTSSLRVLGPFAGLIVAYYALRKHGRKSIPTLIAYAVTAIIVMYLTWPYLWTNPLGNFIASIKTMSLYPWSGQVLFNGQQFASTELPASYLPVLLGLQLTEPLWALTLIGVVVAGIRLREKRELIELSILWLILPLFGFIVMRTALYDNFRQVFFILPPLFWLAGVAIEQVKRPAFQMALIVLAALPGIVDGIRLHPYEYIYYNRFIGGVDGAQGRFELDYWGASYREAAEFVNSTAPANATVWIEGPSQLFELYAREDLKLYSTHEADRADHYDFAVALTRDHMDQASFPNAEVIYRIMRGRAVLAVVKTP
ncbi:MAG TPA: hypothetical protein PLF18_06830 [Anaerolineales bacterium]|nr:hypothetical protein [Anaerolineales bacterium]HNF35181.1 hypothetical protein [Anaerolineales bacterium]HNH04440.1 hypothetical protein [Anaerolineales bacterium]